VPVLPEAVNAILLETSRTDWSAPKVIACLKRDPTLAAHLLRVANSPAFRGAAEVVSLQQAVARLGGSHLRQLAVVIACEGRLFQVPGFVDEVRAVFRHSLACALFGREIARARRANVEDAFLAGLLHDVGWPVLLQTVLDLGRALNVVVPHDEALDAADMAHPQVAHHVAEAWKLPVRVRQAIERHHAGLLAEDELAATVTLADLLARQAAGAAPDEVQLQQTPALSALNLYPDALEALVARGDAVCPWDVVVIGGGPAGQLAAITAATEGQRTLLIEQAPRAGGECVRRGTIPSKTLRETAMALTGFKARSGGVVEVSLGSQVQLESLMRRKDTVVDAHEAFISEQLAQAGVQVWHGHARFTGVRELEVLSVGGERRQGVGRAVIGAGRPRAGARQRLDSLDDLAAEVADGARGGRHRQRVRVGVRGAGGRGHDDRSSSAAPGVPR